MRRGVQWSGGVDRGVPGSAMANREHGRVHCARVDAVLPVFSCLQKQKSKGERGARCWPSWTATLSPPSWRQDGMATGALLPGRR